MCEVDLYLNNHCLPVSVVKPYHKDSLITFSLPGKDAKQKNSRQLLIVDGITGVVSYVAFMSQNDSLWGRQFQGFRADLGVPADPEDRLLLSLRGSLALPEHQHK